MAKKPSVPGKQTKDVRKKTSIGQSVRSRPLNKDKKRSFKRYRGQGK